MMARSFRRFCYTKSWLLTDTAAIKSKRRAEKEMYERKMRTGLGRRGRLPGSEGQFDSFVFPFLCSVENNIMSLTQFLFCFCIAQTFRYPLIPFLFSPCFHFFLLVYPGRSTFSSMDVCLGSTYLLPLTAVPQW